MAVPIGGTPEAVELWKRLETFSVDVGDEQLTFCRRLARENAWSESFAKRVFEEYRRFLFLACASGHKVTPSDEVDQAWHLHLVYTESYWGHLCEKVLRRPLHHGPTKGGRSEDAKFEDWYARTLDSYRRFFGAEPPSDIWPPAQIRFADARRFRRVDTGRHLLVPRAAVLACVLLLGGGLAATAAVAQAGGPPSPAPAQAPSSSMGVGMVWFVVVIVVIAVLGVIRALFRMQGGITPGGPRRRGPGSTAAYGGAAGAGCGSTTTSLDSGKSGCGAGHDSGGDSSGGGSSGCGSSGCGGGGGCGGSGCGS